jgi:hypothetical protein
MSIERFLESKMVFSLDDEYSIRIEKSETYKTLGKGVKVCEFVSNNSGVIVFVEAKHSFSNPENPGDFTADVDAIYEKFLNSLLLYAGLLIGRPYRSIDRVPEHLGLEKTRGAKYRCYLILHGHKDEWLVAVDEALDMRFAVIKRCFAVDSIRTINERMALKHGLIQKIET